MNEKDLVGHTRRRHAPLTREQLDALRAYAQQHGRTWKQSLRDEWLVASTIGPLQRLRNTHGPAWLVSFRLPPQQWMLCPDCEQSFPIAETVPAHTWLHRPCAGSHKGGAR